MPIGEGGLAARPWNIPLDPECCVLSHRLKKSVYYVKYGTAQEANHTTPVQCPFPKYSCQSTGPWAQLRVVDIIRQQVVRTNLAFFKVVPTNF